MIWLLAIWVSLILFGLTYDPDRFLCAIGEIAREVRRVLLAPLRLVR